MDIASQHHAQADLGALRTAMRRASVILLMLLIVSSAFFMFAVHTNRSVPFFPEHFFRVQDIPVAVLFASFWILAARMSVGARGWDWLATGRVPVRWQSSAVLGLSVVLVCAAGVWLLFGAYGLAVDEHWAQSDAIVIGTGAGMVPIAEAWRDYAGALQSRFARITPDGWWASEYLPVNAALQYLGGTLASPLLAGWAVVVAAALARRLLPEQRAAPLLCALLMATSSQLLITGMTPFAMSAHLAFNLSWLWSFLHRDWRAQIAAMPLAVLAIGLHQAVFFPLFATPFLLEAWLTGRRRAAVVQALVIGAGFVLWSSYDALLYAVLGLQPVTENIGGTGTGTTLLFTRFLWLVTNFSPDNIGLMAMNLVRFVTWQNVLVVPLALFAAIRVVREPGPWRAMLVGMGVTTAVVTVLLADQGHGWGYRYLHGYLGSLCLLATLGWYRLSVEIRTGGAARAVLGAGFALSLLLVPLRAWQAASFVAPYARANAAVAAMDADVVLVDAPRHFFALELLRNDPLLRNRPIRMVAAALSDAQLARLCRDYTVARFTDADAARFGLHKVDTGKRVRGVPRGCRMVNPALD
jgi:hypothetical protein